jgi:hypothetical protein
MTDAPAGNKLCGGLRRNLNAIFPIYTELLHANGSRHTSEPENFARLIRIPWSPLIFGNLHDCNDWAELNFYVDFADKNHGSELD